MKDPVFNYWQHFQQYRYIGNKWKTDKIEKSEKKLPTSSIRPVKGGVFTYFLANVGQLGLGKKIILREVGGAWSFALVFLRPDRDIDIPVAVLLKSISQSFLYFMNRGIDTFTCFDTIVCVADIHKYIYFFKCLG